MVLLKGKYHFFSNIKYIQYGLVFCLVPLLNAFFQFSIYALAIAILQNIFIILGVIIVSVLVYRNNEYIVYENKITCNTGVLFKKNKTYRMADVTAISLKRSLVSRVFKATQITMHFKCYPQKKLKLLLPADMAQNIADIVLPIQKGERHYQPTGFERTTLAMISANIITTTFFVLYTIDKISDFFGNGVQKIALLQVSALQDILSILLPTSIALLVSLILIFVFLALVISFFDTYGFSVARVGEVIISKGGLITKEERRIHKNAILYSDMRVTPVTRLLRRYPIYIYTGGFKNTGIPILVYKKGGTKNVQKILPEFKLPRNLDKGKGVRKISKFVWRPLSILALLVLIIIVAITINSAVLATLGLLLFLNLVYLLFSFDAFKSEGYCVAKNKTLFLASNKLTTKHLITIYTNDISMKISQTALEATDGRCNIKVSFAGPKAFKVRGVTLFEADKIPLNLFNIDPSPLY